MYIKYCSFIALHMHNQLMLSLQKKQTQFTFKNQIIQRQKQTNKHYYTFKTCQEVYRKSQLAVSYCMLHFFGGVCVAHPFSFLSCVFLFYFVILRPVSCVLNIASVFGLSTLDCPFNFLSCLLSRLNEVIVCWLNLPMSTLSVFTKKLGVYFPNSGDLYYDKFVTCRRFMYSGFLH